LATEGQQGRFHFFGWAGGLRPRKTFASRPIAFARMASMAVAPCDNATARTQFDWKERQRADDLGSTMPASTMTPCQFGAAPKQLGLSKLRVREGSLHQLAAGAALFIPAHFGCVGPRRVGYWHEPWRKKDRRNHCSCLLCDCWPLGVGSTVLSKCLILLVGAQGLEPWTR
jgi:hypothetical protein